MTFHPRTPFAAAATTVTFTRLPVLVAGALAVALVGTMPPPVAEALWRVSPHELPNLLARWDTMFYYAIATTGYSWDTAVFSHQNVVFFPLYPALMRVLGGALGGHPLIAGLLISLAAFGGAMAVTWRLAALELGSEYAWPAVLLMATFPYALFYSVVYTEALFLLLSVGAFYAMRRGQWLAAAVCGFAAGLTRPNGFWLAVPLLLLAPESSRPRAHTAVSTPDPSPSPVRFDPSCILPIAVAFAPLVGTALYSGYLQVQFHDALAWVHGQAAWGLPLYGKPPAPDPLRLPGEPSIKPIEVVTWVGDIAAFILAAAAILPISRRLGAAYGLWIALNVFPPVAAHLFISLGRFTAVMFPVFFWLAVRIPRSRLPLVVTAFAVGQLLLSVWFFLWQPVV